MLILKLVDRFVRYILLLFLLGACLEFYTISFLKEYLIIRGTGRGTLSRAFLWGLFDAFSTYHSLPRRYHRPFKISTKKKECTHPIFLWLQSCLYLFLPRETELAFDHFQETTSFGILKLTRDSLQNRMVSIRSLKALPCSGFTG